MKTKAFDCVRMKDKIQEEVYEEIRHLSVEGRVAYYQERIKAAPEFQDKFARIRMSRLPVTPGPSTNG